MGLKNGRRLREAYKESVQHQRLSMVEEASESRAV